MVLSIRNLSRFADPSIILAWAAICILQASRLGLFLDFAVFLVGTLANQLLFRCPRCRTSTVMSPRGGFLAPIWTPERCTQCSLDFRDRTFWSPDNHKLRVVWLEQQARHAPPRGDGG
jgi:hypothetical protein